MVRNVSILGVRWGAIVFAAGAALWLSPSVVRAQNLHWVQQFGTPGFDQALATAIDGAGDVYVVGRTRCATGYPYSVGCDAFVHKYDRTAFCSGAMPSEVLMRIKPPGSLSMTTGTRTSWVTPRARSQISRHSEYMTRFSASTLPTGRRCGRVSTVDRTRTGPWESQ